MTNCQQDDGKNTGDQPGGADAGAQKMPDAEVWLFSLLINGYWNLQICSSHTKQTQHTWVRS